MPRYWLFDLRQLVLVAWSVAALFVLVEAIRKGLLGHPDMQVSGNGSSATDLRFFLDHASGPLPAAWLISVPLIFYRLAMLLWALWMASALLRWLRWGYSAFSAGGLWQPGPPRPKKAKNGAPAAVAAVAAAPPPEDALSGETPRNAEPVTAKPD